MAGDSYEYKTITYVPGHGDKCASAEKAENVYCPLAVAIGATIISGMITVYKEVPEQMGREFRAYGANLLLLPANGKNNYGGGGCHSCL